MKPSVLGDALYHAALNLVLSEYEKRFGLRAEVIVHNAEFFSRVREYHGVPVQRKANLESGLILCGRKEDFDREER